MLKVNLTYTRCPLHFLLCLEAPHETKMMNMLHVSNVLFTLDISSSHFDLHLLTFGSLGIIFHLFLLKKLLLHLCFVIASEGINLKSKPESVAFCVILYDSVKRETRQKKYLKSSAAMWLGSKSRNEAKILSQK